MKNGDLVQIDGKKLRIVSSWGQGKHRVFHLEDGQHVIDLHLRKDVVLCNVEASAPSRKDFGRLGKDILPHAEFGEDSHD